MIFIIVLNLLFVIYGNCERSCVLIYNRGVLERGSCLCPVHPQLTGLATPLAGRVDQNPTSFLSGIKENFYCGLAERRESQDEDSSFELNGSRRESPLQRAISPGPSPHQMDPIHPRLPGAHGDSKYIRLWWQIILDFCPCFQFMPCSCVPACSCARVTRWFLCRQLSQFLGKCAPDHPDETALLLFHQSLFLINFAKLNSCDTDWRLCSY